MHMQAGILYEKLWSIQILNVLCEMDYSLQDSGVLIQRGWYLILYENSVKHESFFFFLFFLRISHDWKHVSWFYTTSRGSNIDILAVKQCSISWKWVTVLAKMTTQMQHFVPYLSQENDMFFLKWSLFVGIFLSSAGYERKYKSRMETVEIERI